MFLGISLLETKMIGGNIVFYISLILTHLRPIFLGTKVKTLDYIFECPCEPRIKKRRKERFLLSRMKRTRNRRALSTSRPFPSQRANAQSTKVTPSPSPSFLFISNTSSNRLLNILTNFSSLCILTIHSSKNQPCPQDGIVKA